MDHHPIRVHPRRSAAVSLVSAAAFMFLAAAARGEDGLRTVRVETHGVSVRVPQAWRLTAWAEGARAFLLSLPQERDEPEGLVSCELDLPTADWEARLARVQQLDHEEQGRESPASRLLEARLEESA